MNTQAIDWHARAKEIRPDGRAFIGGRRVVYGSPEYRRLVSVEHRSGGPRRYVVIRGQRVIYGATYQLKMTSEPGHGTCARIEVPELTHVEPVTA